MSLIYNRSKDEWVSVVDCHHCGDQIPTKESLTQFIPVEVYGSKGHKLVIICKKCNRNEILNELGISE